VQNIYKTGEALFRQFQRAVLGTPLIEEPVVLGMRVSYQTDKTLVRRFQREVLWGCFHNNDLEPERYFRSKVKSGEYVLILATEGDEILGGVVIEHDWSTGKKIMLIAWVAVNEIHRGRNIGTLLIEEALVYAKTNGALILLGEIENPEKFKEEESAFGNPEKRVKFYSRFGCQRLEVPYVVPVADGTEEMGMMLTLFPLSEEQATATEISIPEFALFIEELVEDDNTEASLALIEASQGTVQMTPYRKLYCS
jgi:GNAT superfamily N-acetyltransferase